MEPEQITYFAETDARNKKRKFGIRTSDRSKHVYIIGKTGMGKSTLMENMLVQDIKNGEGFAFIDPHGASAEKILDYIPEERIEDVLYFAPFDLENPISFNVMEDVGYDKRHLVVSGLMSAFRKVWMDQWSARMEYILTNTLLALLEYPDATLLGVNKMYVDKVFRKKVVDNVKDPLVKAFWEGEFATYTDRYTQEATPAIQNKIGQFTGNPLIRNIIGQPKSTFDLRKLIDEQKIIIVNLSKGRVGEVNANLLGSMIITKLYLAAMSRADVSEAEMNKLPNFYFYVDEFQSFANESFADILSESRKYKLNLTIAHQYIEQMSEEVRAAVLGNVGTLITFRIGAYDAEVLEKEFAPTFYAQDLVNLGMYQIYLKLMIDGVASPPFSATTLPPIEPPPISYKDGVILASRKKYSRQRAGVEAEINKLHSVEKPAQKKDRVEGGDKHNRTQRTTPRFAEQRRDTEQRRDNRPRREEHTSTRPQPHMEASRHKEQLQRIAGGIKAKQHQPTPPKREEASALKEGLRDALKNALKTKDIVKPKPRDEKQSLKTDQTDQVDSSESKKEPTQAREVPESVLRDVLDVKNDK